MKTKIITILTIIVLALASCKTKQNETEIYDYENTQDKVSLTDEQIKVLNLKLGTFETRKMNKKIKTNGELMVAPNYIAEVSTIVGGNVQSIKVCFGDKVQKGQVLATLEHPDYIILQEEFAKVSNQLDFLEKEYQRQKELFENNVGSGREYQKIKTEYNIIKAQYEALKLRLKLLNISPEKVKTGQITNTINILSPIKGFVTKININIGSYVDVKDVMFEIKDNDAIHADFLVYEKDIHLIKKKQKVVFTVSNRPFKQYTATIFSIEKDLDMTTRSLHVHAKITDKTEDLLPGMFIFGYIYVDSKPTTVLPEKAIVIENEKAYIFVFDEDNSTDNKKTFRMVEVITGEKEGGYIEAKLIKPLPKETKIALNSAYYLLSQMKKEEIEHEH